jgi:hypothetical protein
MAQAEIKGTSITLSHFQGGNTGELPTVEQFLALARGKKIVGVVNDDQASVTFDIIDDGDVVDSLHLMAKRVEERDLLIKDIQEKHLAELEGTKKALTEEHLKIEAATMKRAEDAEARLVQLRIALEEEKEALVSTLKEQLKEAYAQIEQLKSDAMKFDPSKPENPS